MNLTDIEKAVTELSSRHTGLTKEFLRTLLEASGWEEKHIKEAQIIFAAHLKTHQAEDFSSESKNEKEIAPTITSSSNKDITFLRSDGSEESNLPVEISLPKKEDSLPLVAPAYNVQQEMAQQNIPQDHPYTDPLNVPVDTHLHREEDSLITEASGHSKTSSQSLPPDNLPLIPFESSPHVWSFGRYRDTFHPEEKRVEVKSLAQKEKVHQEVFFQETKKEEVPSAPPERVPVIPVVSPIVSTSPSASLQSEETKISLEIDLEKTPITKGDESLVVLAGIMLLAILFILGYMYGNGRL